MGEVPNDPYYILYFLKLSKAGLYGSADKSLADLLPDVFCVIEYFV
jgi:hypothetical protein